MGPTEEWLIGTPGRLKSTKQEGRKHTYSVGGRVKEMLNDKLKTIHDNGTKRYKEIKDKRKAYKLRMILMEEKDREIYVYVIRKNKLDGWTEYDGEYFENTNSSYREKEEITISGE